MAEIKGRLNDLCKKGMEDMQYLFVNYNFVAFFERMLRIDCKGAFIMTIMKKNYSNLPCATIQNRVWPVQTGFVFL